MRLNTPQSFRRFTAEGGPASPHLTPLQALRRSVLSTLLWEDQFYEDGISIADRIRKNAAKVSVEALCQLAVEARTKHNLRHVPLLLLSCLVKRADGSSLIFTTIADTISRADEMAELLAIYWSDKSNKHMVPAQLRKGLAKALGKFNEYSLAKYDRKGAVKLRDVFRLARPTPANEEQSALWKRAVSGELATPDTWEVALSAGADKRETFERLIREGNLGYFALLRNLRNMAQAGCDEYLVREAIYARKGGAEKILPFRFIAAARAAPQFEAALDRSLQTTIAELPILRGRTVVLVDVSGSMNARLSAKSDLTRMDAAAALSAIINGDLRVFTFSDRLVEVPARRGMAGVDVVVKSQPHSGTHLASALALINRDIAYDRIIVITDEQSHNGAAAPKGRGYLINVASYQNGVGYGPWTHIDGFSENVIRFIVEHEAAS